jgi:hypothetical protein
MEMDSHGIAFVAAGLIGAGTAIVHGVLVQRLMVRPWRRLATADGRVGAPVLRLVPMLLHFSTVAWLLGGLALIGVTLWLGEGARLATGLGVGGLFLYGAVCNFWGTRGRHPGWMLMAAAVALIVYGLGASVL